MAASTGTDSRSDTTERPVTMRDVARAAGVSQSTVSRILNDTPTSVPIAAVTRERVQAVASRLGYRPNPLARGLRGAKTMLVGVIVREITDPFFSVAVEALHSEAFRRGYNVVLGTAHSEADEAMALRAVLETRHCDAIVLQGDMRDQPRLLEDLHASRTPIVAMWCGTQLPGVPTVNTDNRAGIISVLDHLYELGHRKVAFIGGRLLGDIRERRTAFVDHTAQSGMTATEDWLHTVANDPAGGDAALRKLMGSKERPSAVVCSSDHIATGVLHAAADLGLRVPADLSVVGFDDIPTASYTVPGLTTVRMPIPEMTEVAVRLAIDEAALPTDGEADSVVVPPTLVTRGSTGQAP